MLTITVEGELETRLRECARRARSEPDNFALATLERSMSEEEDWTELETILAHHGGKGILPALLPDTPEAAQPHLLGAFSSDAEWGIFEEAIAQERLLANAREVE